MIVVEAKENRGGEGIKDAVFRSRARTLSVSRKVGGDDCKGKDDSERGIATDAGKNDAGDNLDDRGPHAAATARIIASL